MVGDRVAALKGVTGGAAADHPADRTYGNWVRYFIRTGYEDPFEG